MSIFKKLRDAFEHPPHTGIAGPRMIPNSMGPLPTAAEPPATAPISATMTAEHRPFPGPQAQGPLHRTFMAGKAAARQGITHSAAAGESEFRNYDRGRIEADAHPNPELAVAYDLDCSVTGDPHGRVK